MAEVGRRKPRDRLFVSSFAARSASSDGTSSTLLCLHGIEAHGLRFFGMAAYLPEHSVVAPDLRGHGRSPQQGPWTIAQHIEDLTTVLEGVGQTAVVVGHSYGGLIAWELARAAPQRVSRLILVDPAIALSPAVARDVREDRVTRRRWRDHPSALTDLLAGRAAEAHWSVALDVAVATARDADGWIRRTVADAAIDACADQVVMPLQPSGYRGPTLLIEAGREHGRYVSKDLVANLRSQLGGSLRHVILDVPHTVPADAPELLAAAMRELLGSAAGTDGAS